MTLQANIRARHVKANNIGEYKSSLYASETVPDEAMTIPYLLSRYVKGLPLPLQREGVNHDTDNFDSVDWEKAKNFDLVDHDNLRDEIAEIEEAHKEQVKKRKAKKAELETASSPNDTSVPEGTHGGTAP